MNNAAFLLVTVPTTSHLAGLDWMVIAIYFGILLAWPGGWSARARTRLRITFLAGRNLGWWVIGASIFASNIGSEHVVGLAGSGATSGVAMAHYELHAWCLLVLAWVFVPFYVRSHGVHHAGISGTAFQSPPRATCCRSFR